ncbi:ly6/PLAUR domain-containing protein 6-like [Liolophura sinensis]|uniref:ly6/PLAUR domain-containing protein 6-like n=1 Tax=Liolophura sinensis TaxID=3198878 RepID=UPI003159220F
MKILSAVFAMTLMIELQHTFAYVINESKQGITCWTCPDKGSNSECNDWAPDRQCPDSKTVCQTVHRFSESTGQSAKVNKQCVLPTECTYNHVGCRSENGVKICVSCCNTPYCNKEAPHNNDTAINLSVTVLQPSSATYASFHCPVMIFVLSATALLFT